MNGSNIHTKNRTYGTVVRGIRAPIITKGDHLCDIACDCLLNFSKAENVGFHDGDILGITEAAVARAQNNYVTTKDIAADTARLFGKDEIGLLFPILSRNRFAICLKGIAMAVKKVYLFLSYPADEVGNHLFDASLLDDTDINPLTRVFSEAEFTETFGVSQHPFTGVDYIGYYKELIESCGAEALIYFSNSAKSILNYTKNVLACDIHTRERTKSILKAAGAEIVLGLDDLCASPAENPRGYNEKYGLLGSNKATEESVKLFPRDCQAFVDAVAAKLKRLTGKNIEVLIYGDGAFKDPKGKIWELADPVVSPAYTKGLEGLSNEIKLKYVADNRFSDLKGEELNKAVIDLVRHKAELSDEMNKEGTTPRKLTDLIGSLCDLASGSGDKGTPFIFIQGYFDNISD